MANKATYIISAKDQTGRATTSASSGFKKLGASVAALGPQLLAVAGIAGMGAMIASTVKAGDQLDKVSKQLGTTTGELQALQYAAKLAGVSNEKLTVSLATMQKNMSDAARGTGEAKDAFKALGIDVKKLMQLSATAQLGVLADALEEVGNQADKTAYLMKIAGEGGREMAALFEDGADGINEMVQSFEDLGVELSQQNIDDLVELNDTWAEFSTILKGSVNVALAELAPIMIAVLESVNEWVKADMAQQMSDFADGVDRVWSGLKKVGDLLVWIGKLAPRLEFDANNLPPSLRNQGNYDYYNTVTQQTVDYTEALKKQNEALLSAGKLTRSFNESLKGLSNKEQANLVEANIVERQKTTFDQFFEAQKALYRGFALDLAKKYGEPVPTEAEIAASVQESIDNGQIEEGARNRFGDYQRETERLIKRLAELRTAVVGEEKKIMEDLSKSLDKVNQQAIDIRRDIEEARFPDLKKDVQTLLVVPDLVDTTMTPQLQALMDEVTEWAGAIPLEFIINRRMFEELFEDIAIKVTEFTQAMVDGVNEFTYSLASSLGDAVRNWDTVSLWTEITENFGSMLERAGLNAMAVIAERGVTKLLDKLLEALLKTGLSTVPIIGPILAALVPAKASGGYVASNTAYLVGEQGPELFTPGTGGNITPNNKMGGTTNYIRLSFPSVIPASQEDLRRAQHTISQVNLAGARFAL